jgi:hypothetical protein
MKKLYYTVSLSEDQDEKDITVYEIINNEPNNVLELSIDIEDESEESILNELEDKNVTLIRL